MTADCAGALKVASGSPLGVAGPPVGEANQIEMSYEVVGCPLTVGTQPSVAWPVPGPAAADVKDGVDGGPGAAGAGVILQSRPVPLMPPCVSSSPAYTLALAGSSGSAVTPVRNEND